MSANGPVRTSLFGRCIYITSIYDVALEKEYLKNIGLLAEGEMDINTAFRTAEEAANKAIAEAKSK